MRFASFGDLNGTAPGVHRIARNTAKPVSRATRVCRAGTTGDIRRHDDRGHAGRIGAEACRVGELMERATGRYFGELDPRFEYKGRSGAHFSVLQIDYPTLARVAQPNVWRCELMASDGGHYLARARPV